MPICMQIAKTTAEIDSVYLLRHAVFVQQQKLLKPRIDGRIYDRYDSFSSTVQMIAQQEGKTIGTFRVSLEDDCGLPTDEHFNFRQFIPQDSTLIHTGLFCIDRRARADKVALGLILMATYYAISNKAQYVSASVSPLMAPLLQRIGFKNIGREFSDPLLNINVVPLLLNLHDLKDFFVDFIYQHQLHEFIMDYQRWFCKEGETIVKTGDEGDKAFIIIDGIAEVILPQTGECVAILSDGEMFGELAVITNERRTADVIAKTDVHMMVMTKEIFLKRFVEDSQKALILMRMISSRSRPKIEL